MQLLSPGKLYCYWHCCDYLVSQKAVWHFCLKSTSCRHHFSSCAILACQCWMCRLNHSGNVCHVPRTPYPCSNGSKLPSELTPVCLESGWVQWSIAGCLLVFIGTKSSIMFAEFTCNCKEGKAGCKAEQIEGVIEGGCHIGFPLCDSTTGHATTVFWGCLVMCSIRMVAALAPVHNRVFCGAHRWSFWHQSTDSHQ